MTLCCAKGAGAGFVLKKPRKKSTSCYGGRWNCAGKKSEG